MTSLTALDGDPPPEAFAAALAGLPAMWPSRLRSLLRRHAPVEAWVGITGEVPFDVVITEVVARHPDVLARWRTAARTSPPTTVWQRCIDAGIRVDVLGSERYPAALAGDPEAPAVLFSLGEPAAIDGRRVAIIGTRNATATGRAIAHELGAGLAVAGVRVVSGLARGIDGWAHRGALSASGAPPIGVVACGLDVVYPPEHRRLWADVAAHGVLLAEVPPGTRPDAFRFPLRNRVLAALAELVVVVESRVKGGSLVTVDAAERRGVPIMAVPGSPRSAAADGTNRLIADGATPVLDVTDVLVALGLSTARTAGARPDGRVPPRGTDREVLELFAAEPLDLERVMAASGCSLADAALALARLEATGWLVRTGAWFERAMAGLS